jgi:RNase P protein component
LREAARLSGITGSHDIILTAREPAVRASFGDVVRSLRKLARRAGIPAGERPEA